jgi:hypothetical protein
MQSRAAARNARDARGDLSRAKGTCNWTTKGTTSPPPPPPAPRQRALCGTRDGGAARHCAARRGAARRGATRRDATRRIYLSPTRRGGLAQSSTDRQRRESRGVRVEPRHDTEDLHEPRRRLGAFLKRAERRGRRRNDDGEGIRWTGTGENGRASDGRRGAAGGREGGGAAEGARGRRQREFSLL